MSRQRFQLIIGSKAWSSWSLRPWLLMRQFAVPFDETVIALRAPGTAAEIAAHSPSGKIPVLIDAAAPGGALTVYDSLAIVEYLADVHPGLPIWPTDPIRRAIARSVSAEMHAGFQALRQNCPMDFNGRNLNPADPAAITADVRRIVAIWEGCRAAHGAGGPFLFGAFCAADAMYAPVVSRFTSYAIDPATHGGGATAAAYMAAVWALPAMSEWAAGASDPVAIASVPVPVSITI